MELHEQILVDILDHFSSKIKAGTCKMSADQSWETIKHLVPFVREDDRLSRTEVEKALNMTTSTFYRRKKEGKVKEGIKLPGKARFWLKPQH